MIARGAAGLALLGLLVIIVGGVYGVVGETGTGSGLVTIGVLSLLTAVAIVLVASAFGKLADRVVGANEEAPR